MNTNVKNGHKPLSPLNARMKNAIASSPGYAPTSTARNGSGFHRGAGKPTGGPGQWLLVPGAKLPPRAFEPLDKERQRFYLLAKSVPLNGDPLSDVQRIGGEIFDASYGAEAAKFRNEAAAGQLELERLNSERARLEREISITDIALDDIPVTAESEQAVPSFPPWFCTKWWGFVACLFFLCVSSGAALLQIANIYLPTMQSWPFAAISASPWIIAAVAAEIFLLLTIKSESPKITLMLRIAMCVLFVGLILWLAGLFVLAAPLDIATVTGRNFLLPDRRWAISGQLLCELAVSWLMMTGMLRLLVYRRVTLVNENRRRIFERISQLNLEWAAINKEIGAILIERAKPEGNLLEWENSRAAFIEEGVAIVRLRLEDGSLLDEIRRQRGANEHLLSQFSV